MLPPAQTLANEILALPASPIPLTGITAFVGVITSYMANVQGGPTGLPGIFTLNSALVIAAMTAMKPVTDNSWISSFADAMEDGIVAAIITPGTVTEPVWVTSVTDVSTLPLGASTITTIAAAKAKLIFEYCKHNIAICTIYLRCNIRIYLYLHRVRSTFGTYSAAYIGRVVKGNLYLEDIWDLVIL